MSEESIDTQVITIVCHQLDLKRDEIGEDFASKNFTEDLGADSLAIVELVLALEEHFGIKIPDEEVETIKTVGDAIKYINRTRRSA